MDQQALHVRFPNASQEPLWPRNMRPLRLPEACPLAQTPVVVCKVSGRPSFAAPLIGFWAHGARPHIHPAVTVGGPFWHSVCDGLRVSLVRQYVIMRLRILATIAIDPLRNYTQLHQPAKPHRHKQRPITHHHGHGPCKCVFLFALNCHTHPSRGPPFAQSPLGSPQMTLAILSSLR